MCSIIQNNNDNQCWINYLAYMKFKSFNKLKDGRKKNVEIKNSTVI